MSVQYVLDLGRREVLTPSSDDFLLAGYEVENPVPIDADEIASV